MVSDKNMSSMREEVYSKLHPFFEDLVDIACDNIEKLEKEDCWISVKERLPDTDNDVLITYKSNDEEDDYRNIAISCYREETFGGRPLGVKDWRSPFEYFSGNYDVIAWMPLPEVYMEEN